MINDTYKLKYREIRRMNTYKKALMLENIFGELFLHKSKKELIHMLSGCAHYHYGQKGKPLTDDCKAMYEYLVTHNYNPYTVYKWFLLFLTDEMVREYVEEQRLSQQKIKRVVTTRRKQEELSRCWNFMQEARKTAQEMLYYV